MMNETIRKVHRALFILLICQTESGLWKQILTVYFDIIITLNKKSGYTGVVYAIYNLMS